MKHNILFITIDSLRADKVYGQNKSSLTPNMDSLINNGIYFTQAIRKVPTYPDMKLWQEIIFLNQFFKGLWMVENVIPFYEPFLPQYTQIGRHFIWSNFRIPKIEMPKNEIGTMMKQYVGTGKHAHDKSLEDRNAVNSELGLHILNCGVGKILIKKDYEQYSLFGNGM